MTAVTLASETALRSLSNFPFSPISPCLLQQRVEEFITTLQSSLPHHVGPYGHLYSWEEGRGVKCSTPRGLKDFWYGDHMSQRKSVVGSTSKSTDGSHSEAPTSSTGLEALYTGQNPQEASKGSGQVSASTLGANVAVGVLDQKPSRLDVNKILNPTPPGDQGMKNRRRSAGHLDSLPSSGGVRALSRLPRSPTTDLGSGVLGTPPSASAQSGTLGRRILTPRSPGFRAASMGRPSITGMMNAQQSPFIHRSGGVYSVDSGVSGAPPELQPAPTAPTGQPLHLASPYGFPPTAPTPPVPSRRASSVVLQIPQSQAASPSTSYSSFSQPSPASHFRPLVSQELQPSYPPQFSSRGIQQGSGRSTGSPPESSYSNAPGGWQQNKYQLFFGSGEQGSIPVPVDIHAASKQADEKRKRNAGASARFRARRKEKEREASHTISKLEQQIRDLIEERDFYHNERDYFRSILYSSPQQGQLPPRPLSPRLRSNRQVQYMSVGTTSNSPWTEDQDEDAMSSRHTRRRTNVLPNDHVPRPPDVKAPLGGSPTGYTFAPATSDQRIDLACSDSNAVPRSAPYNPFQPDIYDRGRHPGP